MATNDNLRGALLMSLAMASFTINDSMIKLVTGDLTTAQILFIRGMFTTTLILVVVWSLGALKDFRKILNPWIGFRAVGEVGGSVTYVMALAHMPLPNTAAILQALPLAVTMGAAIFFREPVGWRRWMAILIGFAGVLVIIRPGAEGFTSAALLVVGSVIFAASRDLITKRIDKDTPSILVSVSTSIAVTLTGALLIPLEGWKPVSGYDLGVLAFGATMLFAGYQTIIMAMRTGEISFIAPFRYTSLLWAIALGILLLGEFPDFWTIVGSIIVILAGLYAFYRESVRQRQIMATVENNMTA